MEMSASALQAEVAGAVQSNSIAAAVKAKAWKRGPSTRGTGVGAMEPHLWNRWTTQRGTLCLLASLASRGSLLNHAIF